MLQKLFNDVYTKFKLHFYQRMFERLQERIVTFVSGHSQISAELFQSLMLKKEDMAADVGSVIYGEEAVSLGLIDQVGGLSDGLQYLYRRIDERKKQA